MVVGFVKLCIVILKLYNNWKIINRLIIEKWNFGNIDYFLFVVF